MTSRPAQALLPNEPRQINWTKEKKLSDRFLLSEMASIEAFLYHLRSAVDEQLQSLQPFKAGKPYPLGQCLEITLAMQRRLKQINNLPLKGAPAVGRAALNRFLTRGGTMRQIWGDLRGEYFQNAFLIGTLYVDVSNDTVIASKPKIEILPFENACLSPIMDFEHFARLARKYWKAEVLPNCVLPRLAPYAPLICVFPDGSVQLHDTSKYMVNLTLRDAFIPSQTFLTRAPIDMVIFQQLVACLKGTANAIPNSPDEGRQLAVAQCQKYAEKLVQTSTEQINEFMKNITAVNQHLTQFKVSKYTNLTPNTHATYVTVSKSP